MSRMRSRSLPCRLWAARSTGNVDPRTRSVLIAVTMAAVAAAQHAAEPLEVPLEIDFETDPAVAAAEPEAAAARPPDCSAFLRAATACLHAAGDGDVRTGPDAAGPLLAFLWLGDDARARE